MKPIIATIAQSAYTTLAGIRNTEWCTNRVLQDGIDGNLVECGVGAGAQLGVMGVTMNDYTKGNRRKIWAYDSYQGIPLACEKDDCQPSIGYFKDPIPFVEDKETLLVSSGVTVHSKKNVMSNITKWGLDVKDFNFIEGWFQHTLPLAENRPEKIALLRLDGDMYESTKVCLEYLFPLVTSGGIVIVDDFALAGARIACEEYFAKIGINPKLIEIGEGEEKYGSVYFFKE